jgi:rubrerythrin
LNIFRINSLLIKITDKIEWRMKNMPAFANPFQGNVDRKLTKEELVQAIRLDIAGELEAIYLYDAHVQATDNEIAKKVIADIRDEEKAHMGELMTLLRTLDPKEAEFFASGEEEVREMLDKLGIHTPAMD